jgi:hypothetical protein
VLQVIPRQLNTYDGVFTVSLKMVKVVLLALGAVLLAGAGIWFVRSGASRIAHQRPYKWDQYPVPRLRFTNEPIVNVVSSVNDAVTVLSQGAVQQVILLDTTPVRISKFAPNPGIEQQMDEMIRVFRQHEEELKKKRAEGFETGLYTGVVGGGHSLGCIISDLASNAGLGYEEKPDGIHMKREPHELECRAYGISKALVALMEQKRKVNDLHVDAEPVVSALAQATGIHSWSVMVPDGPNSATGEFRFDKVFRHLPEANLILALATAEEHSNAVVRLKTGGLWAEIPAEQAK